MFGYMHRHDSDCEDELTDDDSVEDEFLGGIANRLRRKYERYEKSAGWLNSTLLIIVSRDFVLGGGFTSG